MSSLCITDNDYAGKELTPEQQPILSPYESKTLKEIAVGNPGLFVYPNLGETDDEIEEEQLFSIKDNKIRTGNLMGFVSVSDDSGNKVEVSITSRFAQGEEDGQQDYFLHYMLSRVLNINIVDLEHSSSNDGLRQFLVYLFPRLLHLALSQGLIKEYKWYSHNDSNLRGTVDVARHIARNVPFAGKIAYNTRERTSDNNTTELIRHTIEYIKVHYRGVLERKDIHNDVAAVVQATPGYSRSARAKVIADNIRGKVHPYYSKYVPLRRLCLAILNRESLRYGHGGKNIEGILFNGAWLWEEYLNTLLEPMGYIHAENKKRSDPLYPFSNSKKSPKYPDFRYTQDGKAISEQGRALGVILDAKYKRLNKDDNGNDTKVDADDINQMLAYLYITQYKTVGLLYPIKDDNMTGTDCKLEANSLKGYGGTLFTLGLPIPCPPERFPSLSSFAEHINKREQEFVKVLNPLKNLKSPATMSILETTTKN